MKTARCFVSLFALLFCTVSYGTVRAADGVPKAVLDLRQSVVRVICQTNDGTYTGSGFAIGAEEPVKFIVTNLHVVAPNVNEIKILRENNREIPAKIYLRVDNADLCVLLLEEALYGVPPLVLADAGEAAVGQAVFALGFPGAADVLADTATGNSKDVTVTDGIISAVKSFTYVENGTPISLLQINAAINPGNSGGPLADDKGHILGVNSLGVQDAQSVNGAVSIRELTGALKARGFVYLSASDKENFPWLLIIIISGAFVLICAAALVTLMIFRSKKRKSMHTSTVPSPSVPLPVYLQQWGGKLPYDMTMRLLTPVLAALSAMHTAGRMHGDICPEVVTVDPNNVQAALRAPESSVQGGRLVLRPGFSAPEQYRADGRLGPWSDVYSACAVFYYVITGKAPQGVMERMGQSEIALNFDNAIIDVDHATALLAGLQLDAAQRPQNAMELINALGIAIEEPAHFPEPIPSAVMPASAVTIAKPAKKKMKKGKRLLIAGLATVAVLCAGAGGYYLYNDYMYNRALECINKQDYKGGIDNLSNVLRVYKSTAQWMKYTCAGYALQQNDFNTARTLFSELVDFQKSNEMIKEVNYLQAHYLMTNGYYSEARSTFDSLGDYKDSKSMQYEVDYQEALALANNQDYYNALKKFEILSENKYRDSKEMCVEMSYQFAIQLYNSKDYSIALTYIQDLSGYKDGAYYLDLCRDALYTDAVNKYRNKQFVEADALLISIGDYKDSSVYRTLVEAHNITEYTAETDYTYTKQIFQKLQILYLYEDAQALMLSDVFIEYKLEGYWKDKYGDALSLIYQTKDNGWYISYILPHITGKYYKIENCIVYLGDDENGWTANFSIDFASENAIQVYCYKDKQYYQLSR